MRAAFVLASGNRNKVREFAAILAPHRVVPMPPGVQLPPEGVTSFRENALGKARALAARLMADTVLRGTVLTAARTGSAAAGKLICLADDSGLEVEALGWSPGVMSSRYAGADATDAENNAKLLRELRGRSALQRRARFVCVAAAVVLPLVSSAGSLRDYVASGQWWGTIAEAPHGDGGFGYDPLFLPEGSALTVAQLPRNVKDQVSHRALAGKAILELLSREGVLDGVTTGVKPAD